MTNPRFHAREGKRSEAVRVEAAKAASDEELEPKLRIMQCFGGTSGAHFLHMAGIFVQSPIALPWHNNGIYLLLTECQETWFRILVL